MAPCVCTRAVWQPRNTHARTYTREHALTLSLERCTDYVTVAFTTLRFGRFDWVARSNFSSLEGKFGREGMNGRSSVHRADTRLSSIREEVTVESSGDEHCRYRCRSRARLRLTHLPSVLISSCSRAGSPDYPEPRLPRGTCHVINEIRIMCIFDTPAQNRHLNEKQRSEA